MKTNSWARPLAQLRSYAAKLDVGELDGDFFVQAHDEIVEADSALYIAAARVDTQRVVGDVVIANNSLGVNPRGGEVERGVGLDEFIVRLHEEIAVQLASV